MREREGWERQSDMSVRERQEGDRQGWEREREKK